MGDFGGQAWGAVGGTFAQSTAGIVGFGALAGGVGSALSGGNFWQGAVIGGTVAGLNSAMHKGGKPKPLSSWMKNYLNHNGILDYTADYTKMGYTYENTYIGTRSTDWTTSKPDSFFLTSAASAATAIALEGFGISGLPSWGIGTGIGSLSSLNVEYKADYYMMRQSTFFGKITYNVLTGTIKNVQTSKIVTQTTGYMKKLYQRVVNTGLNYSTMGNGVLKLNSGSSFLQQYNYGIPKIGGNAY